MFCFLGVRSILSELPACSASDRLGARIKRQTNPKQSAQLSEQGAGARGVKCFLDSRISAMVHEGALYRAGYTAFEVGHEDGLAFCGRSLTEAELELIRGITREFAHLAWTELAATIQ